MGRMACTNLAWAGAATYFTAALGRDNVRLLLSASPAHPRAQLTRVPRENPETPPMFCMLLRKHFAGARLLDVVLPHAGPLGDGGGAAVPAPAVDGLLLLRQHGEDGVD